MKVLSKHLSEIYNLCNLHKVKQLYAFGSVLTNKFNRKSDIDLIVTFDAIAIEDYADNYYDFKFSLQDVLKRSVDLLEEQAITNPYFKQSIDQQKELIYAH